MKLTLPTLALCWLALMPLTSQALTGVHPTGVNINRHDVTTVFLTFLGTENEQAGDAFWCLRLNAPPNVVTATNPCVPGTIIGHLPARLDLSRSSAGGANTTDIMTIPASVSRRAIQSAQRDQGSQFFYVREFISNTGQRSFVSVTCRLASGGARVPFALTHVEPAFDVVRPEGVTFIAAGAKPPPVIARIRYTGSGTLRGRWEVVMPGESLPEPFDLLPEGSLPVEERIRQKRYTVLSQFDIFLPPVGEAIVPGPPVDRIPVQAKGAYRLLLRIEASADKEGDSNTGFGVVQSGGLAGFAIPPLRYQVGEQGQGSGSLLATGPENDSDADPQRPLYLSWQDSSGASLLSLELLGTSDTPLFSALLPPGTGYYIVPAHVRSSAGATLRWRVVGLDASGREMTATTLQRVKLGGSVANTEDAL